MRKPIKTSETITCPNCKGRGEIDNPVWRGKEMRQLRKSASKTLTEVARVMKFSKGYLSDLELGRRAWSESLILAYEKALKVK